MNYLPTSSKRMNERVGIVLQKPNAPCNTVSHSFISEEILHGSLFKSLRKNKIKYTSFPTAQQYRGWKLFI